VKPVAWALPRADERIEAGRYGSMIPMTPANGMTLICRTKPGTGNAIRTAEAAIAKGVTGVEVVKALKVKQALSGMLDQIQ
jgi:hypothetical protein